MMSHKYAKIHHIQVSNYASQARIRRVTEVRGHILAYCSITRPLIESKMNHETDGTKQRIFCKINYVFCRDKYCCQPLYLKNNHEKKKMKKKIVHPCYG